MGKFYKDSAEIKGYLRYNENIEKHIIQQLKRIRCTEYAKKT